MESELLMNIDNAAEGLKALNMVPEPATTDTQPYELKISFNQEIRRWRLSPTPEGYKELQEFLNKVCESEKFTLLLNDEKIADNSSLTSMINKLSLFQVNNLVLDVVREDPRISRLEKKILCLQNRLLKLKSKPMKEVRNRDKKMCKKKQAKLLGRTEKIQLKMDRRERRHKENKDFNVRIVKAKCTPPPSEVKPGEIVQTTVVLLNGGSTAWPEGSLLKSICRKRQAPFDDVKLSGEVPPGEEVSVVLVTTAPERQGQCCFNWQLVSPLDLKARTRIKQRYRVASN